MRTAFLAPGIGAAGSQIDRARQRPNGGGKHHTRDGQQVLQLRSRTEQYCQLNPAKVSHHITSHFQRAPFYAQSVNVVLAAKIGVSAPKVQLPLANTCWTENNWWRGARARGAQAESKADESTSDVDSHCGRSAASLCRH